MTNLILLGKPEPFNLVRGFLLHVRFSPSFPHHTDVSNSRTYRDVNRCDTNASRFDGLHILWVLCFPPSPFCPNANCCRCCSCQAFGACPTRKGRMANTDPKRIFAPPIPLTRVELAVHESSESSLPANMGQYGQNGSVSQSQDQSFVLDVNDDLENSVKRG